MKTPNLEVSVEHRVGALAVLPRGEVDLATAPVFEEAMQQAVRVPRVPVVVDLSGLDFLACRGLGLLATARHALWAAGRALTVTGASSGSALQPTDVDRPQDRSRASDGRGRPRER